VIEELPRTATIAPASPPPVRHPLPLLLVLSLTAGCVGPIRSLYPARSGEPVRTIYVVNHGGLHTGIAVERADIPTNVWPANHDYPQARYLEIGWGDDDGYRKDLTPWIVIKGLFWPTRSVLLIDGFTNSVAKNFEDHADLGFFGKELAAREHKEHKEKKAGPDRVLSQHQARLGRFFGNTFGADT
jgi:hypothetical protein